MLKYKLLKWFGGLVLVFGVLSAALGIWMIHHRVIQEAQTRVRYDLSSAWAVYQSQLGSLETIIKLTAGRNILVDACADQKWSQAASAAAGLSDTANWRQVCGALAKLHADFGLDFVAVVSPDGCVVGRAPSYQTGDYQSAQPLVAQALAGSAAAGTVLLSRAELANEADGLVDRAFLTLQETPHARPSPRDSEDRGMAMMAAAPIEKNGRVIGVLYGGILLNRNQAFVDRIQGIVFGQERYHGKPVGSVTVFLGDTRVTTTVLLSNANRAIGTRVSKEVADRVLDNGASWVDRAFVVNEWYLTAYDPIRDPRGGVIGMLYVGTLEKPFSDLGRGMVMRYSALVAMAMIVALLMALFIAGKVAKPLHRLSEAARKMEEGQGFEPISMEHGSRESARLIGAFNDMAVTLQRREQELREANERLGSTNDSLMAANARYMETLQFVSHELNSPLSAITNYTYMLREKLLGSLTEKQEHALEVMTGNLKRVMEMIRHYLNLSRIESGDWRVMPSRIALREQVIAPILASLESEILAKGMIVEDDINPHLLLHSDLNMTREVFENLLGNAVKYGRDGGRISLSCQPDGIWAACRVRNEGDGIPPESRQELFRKFSRLESSDHGRRARGTGLGLFIAKKIVEAHGGTISVDSMVGQWTEFRCTLPLERESDAPSIAPKTSP